MKNQLFSIYMLYLWIINIYNGVHTYLVHFYNVNHLMDNDYTTKVIMTSNKNVYKIIL